MTEGFSGVIHGNVDNHEVVHMENFVFVDNFLFNCT